MNEPFSDELLSAYLDGELPREERAHVEQWLTASAEHRRLLDDLKAIRRELQALPKQSLDAGFSDRVLAAIHQRTGESASDPPASGSSSGAESTETPPIKPVNLPDRHLGMPAWRWFAAGVAATLLAVILGMNAAPETMAQMGRLAQVVRPSTDEVVRKKTEPSNAAPAASAAPRAELPANVELAPAERSGPGKRQRDPGDVVDSTNKDLRESFANNPEMRKEAAPGEKPAEPQLESSTPDQAAGPVPAPAPGVFAESFDKSNGDNDGRDRMENEAKKAAAGGIADGQAADTYADVIELPVSGDQAERALAFYAQTAGRQAAQRYSNSNVATLTVPGGDEQAADKFAAADNDNEEAVLQRSAAGMSLLKLMDAATRGVQVAALDIAGPEAEVQALLDSLGVEQARDLRPSREFLGGGAGGVYAFRATREAEQAAAGAEGKPAAAAGKVVAKADGARENAEQAKGGSTAPKNLSRGGARGGFPSVKMRSVYEGNNEGVRDQAKRAIVPQQEGANASQPQLRVRLVFVPAQTDPIGATIEVKPAD